MLSLTSVIIVSILICLAGTLLWRSQMDHSSPHFEQKWSTSFFVASCVMGALNGAFPHPFAVGIIGIIYMLVLQNISDHYRIQMMSKSVRAAMANALKKFDKLKITIKENDASH